MVWLGHAGLLLTGFCLLGVVDGSRADASRDRLVSQAFLGQIENNLVLAADESAAPRAQTPAGAKTIADPEESKGSPSAPAPAKPVEPVPAKTPRIKGIPAVRSDKPVFPAAEDRTAGAAPKAPSLVQRLEGRESDLMIWLGVAVVFFLVGWIGGGIHARRRERLRRTRLRF
jgi:hypothetical protein